MHTVSEILADINRGCMANNMVEDRFTYRIVFFVNEGSKGQKYCIDTSYSDLRKSLEEIVREHLSLTNNVVVAETTVLKGGKCVCLQSRAYVFSLESYFNQISGEDKGNVGKESIVYRRYTKRHMK